MPLLASYYALNENIFSRAIFAFCSQISTNAVHNMGCGNLLSDIT